MVLLPNMFKATSPASESVPVGYFFNHKFCSNSRADRCAAVFSRILVQPDVRPHVSWKKLRNTL
jgi:hypothetical protein